MDQCPGTITIEYYDGSSDFSDSDVSQCPNKREQSSSSSRCSSSSTPNIRDSISCKTYDFKHASSETECNDNELREGEMVRKTIFSDTARVAMSGHFAITHQERIESLVHPKASFPRCPRGDVPEQYGRRKHPGPFLTCSFSHSHECGDDFVKIHVPTKPVPEFDSFTRPQHLKERKAKFFKQCKHCETIGFSHHRNPARHYEDYLNNVTYKLHNDHAKVWQQHVVDLMYMQSENSNSYTIYADDDIVEKCKHYTPSEAIVKATRCSRNTQRRIPTVITRKRMVVARPLRRPLPKANASKISSLTQTTHARVNLPEQKHSFEINQRKTVNEEVDHPSLLLDAATTRYSRSRRKPKEKHLHSIRRSSLSSDINTDGRKPNALHQRLNASAKRLINSRQASSKISKRFVKKPEPPKEAKYIQRGKPNISAKFLRARSKNKVLHSTSTPRSSHLASPTVSRSKGRSSINVKKLRSAQTKSGRASRKNYRQNKTSDLKDDSSDDGSYAQYRDRNGEFDVEKYRQSILKMLSKNVGNGTVEKKRKQKRASHSNQTTFVALPNIRNVYRNVKPRVTSNFTQRKRRNVEKLKNDGEFDVEVPSDVSLTSKYWNDDSLASVSPSP